MFSIRSCLLAFVAAGLLALPAQGSVLNPQAWPLVSSERPDAPQLKVRAHQNAVQKKPALVQQDPETDQSLYNDLASDDAPVTSGQSEDAEAAADGSDTTLYGHVADVSDVASPDVAAYEQHLAKLADAAVDDVSQSEVDAALAKVAAATDSNVETKSESNGGEIDDASQALAAATAAVANTKAGVAESKSKFNVGEFDSVSQTDAAAAADSDKADAAAAADSDKAKEVAAKSESNVGELDSASQAGAVAAAADSDQTGVVEAKGESDAGEFDSASQAVDGNSAGVVETKSESSAGESEGVSQAGAAAATDTNSEEPVEAKSESNDSGFDSASQVDAVQTLYLPEGTGTNDASVVSEDDYIVGDDGDDSQMALSRPEQTDDSTVDQDEASFLQEPGSDNDFYGYEHPDDDLYPDEDDVDSDTASDEEYSEFEDVTPAAVQPEGAL